jgi:hypothetical protein
LPPLWCADFCAALAGCFNLSLSRLDARHAPCLRACLS